MTAMAMVGFSAGAKPMNQEWGRLPSPSCAEPLLPATVTPGTLAPPAKEAPNWPSTACTMACLTSAARSDGNTFDRTCAPIVVTAPDCARNSSTSLGFISTPLLAMVEATSAICSGVTSVSPWPYAALASSTWSVKPLRGPPPLVTWLDDVGRSNGMGPPKPSLADQATMFCAPICSPACAYQMLLDTSVAS